MMSACVERMLTFAGFGDFLHDLDPEREWHEHLKHMLVFCSVHVKRNFAKRFPKHPARHIINQIWHEATLEALLERMDSICTLYPELKSWINSKKADWILAGLTTEQTKVPYHWWVYARKHLGIGESSHFSDNNYTGRNISLLAAVLR